MTEQTRRPPETGRDAADAFATGGGTDSGDPALPRAGAKLVLRTGAEQPWDPVDLALAEGRDPTPENIERARRVLERDGAAAIERTVP